MRIIDIIKLIISLLLWGGPLSSVEVYDFFRNAAHERIRFGFGSTQEFNRALLMEEYILLTSFLIDNCGTSSPRDCPTTDSESMQSKESSEHLLGVLVESMASSLLSNYLKAMGIVDSKSEIEDQIRSAKKNQTKK